MGEVISEMEDSSDSSDMECTSPAEPVPVEEIKIGVFWDVVACPFPDKIDPDLIYQKIESVLIERGARHEVSIFAYVDDKKECWEEFLRKKTWKARLDFIPQGDKLCLRMLNDIIIWQITAPAPATMIVVSDKVRHTNLSKRLQNVTQFGYTVYILEPTGCVSPQNLEWPGFLLDHLLYFPSWIESEKVNPAKRSAVGEGSKDQGCKKVNPAKRSAVGEGSNDQGCKKVNPAKRRAVWEGSEYQGS